MNLVELNVRYSTEAKCREQLKRLRWPEGVICPRCKSKTISRLFTQSKFECSDCEYQFSVTAGTIFNDSHLPLTTWFLATLLICESKKGMSACQIQRTLGLGSYKTAWYLCHRIRASMVESQRAMLSGKVEMDETFVGGKNWWQGKNSLHQGKEVVIGIRQRGGDLRFFHAKDARSGTLEKYIRENLSEDVEILYTDDWKAYRSAAKHLRKDGKHKTIRHKLRVYAKGDVYTNTVESAFSLLKRGIMGTWHQISAKHLQAYCEEMTFRFNRRENPNLFVDTLRHMVTAPVLTFEKLTA
ncbi:MAG: IS1595 family transposase [Candidatus Acidiferrales bacterium]